MQAIERYAPLSRWLHWIAAILIIALLISGVVLEDLPKGDLRQTGMMFHKSFGVIVLALMLVRLGARFVLGVPAADRDLLPWQRHLSGLVHAALYLVVLAQAAVGYVASSICCAPVKLFGLIEIPLTFTGTKSTHDIFAEAHEIGGNLLILLVVAHIAGGLYHHYVLRDRIMARMSLCNRS